MKNKDLGYIVLGILSIFLFILLVIAIIFWKDCYNRMNELEQQLYEEQQEVEILKDKNNQLQMDVEDCDWYIRFYDEFHDEVGAFE